MFENWTDEKKIVENRLNINFRINVNQETKIKYRITPWSVWWFDIGENVGTETGGHVYTDPSKQYLIKDSVLLYQLTNFIMSHLMQKLL